MGPNQPQNERTDDERTDDEDYEATEENIGENADETLTQSEDEVSASRERERVRDVLARTVRFLTSCAKDPESAMAAEDPRELIRALESLGVEEPPAREAEEPRAIPLRRRRSA